MSARCGVLEDDYRREYKTNGESTNSSCVIKLTVGLIAEPLTEKAKRLELLWLKIATMRKGKCYNKVAVLPLAASSSSLYSVEKKREKVVSSKPLNKVKKIIDRCCISMKLSTHLRRTFSGRRRVPTRGLGCHRRVPRRCAPSPWPRKVQERCPEFCPG